mmetsp:Transcript_13794/g.24151  ORF Transcript_13794/g.24151 Transcript_13794/m.24151 type:complete len:161 (-) Transcript_13794:243-725(-)
MRTAILTQSGMQSNSGRPTVACHSKARSASFSRSFLMCKANSSGSSAGAGSSGGSSNSSKRVSARRARLPGLFEVKVCTPPPKSLGIYALPPLTHNGEEIDIEGQGYVVTATYVQMKLQKGQYVRDHSRLDVTPTGRWVLQQHLNSLLKATFVGPTGLQD